MSYSCFALKTIEAGFRIGRVTFPFTTSQNCSGLLVDHWTKVVFIEFGDFCLTLSFGENFLIFKLGPARYIRYLGQKMHNTHNFVQIWEFILTLDMYIMGHSYFIMLRVFLYQKGKK